MASENCLSGPEPGRQTGFGVFSAKKSAFGEWCSVLNIDDN